MTCERYEEEIAFDVGGDLGSARAVALAGHLADCGRCRAFRAEMAATALAIGELRAEPVGEGDLVALRRRVREALDAPHRQRWAAIPTWTLAASVLVVFGFALWFGRVSVPRSDVAPVIPEASRHGTALSDQQPSRHGKEVSASKALRRTPSTARGAALAVAPARAERPSAPAPDRTVAGEPIPGTTAGTPGPLPLLIKLVTSDPNIVIYWLVDSNGGPS